jgi:hypothetical protein
MASDSQIRASDADRDGTVGALREHLAAGRLTTEEFEERLDKAYTAKTLAELDDLVADLPGADLEQLPGASLGRAVSLRPLPVRRSRGSVEARPGRFSLAWRAAWGSWLAISLLFFVIWLVSGASGGLWFLWVALPLGALLLGRWIMGAPVGSERRPVRRNRRHRDSGQVRQ